ncbi:MAG: M48 family metallopeptidase [Nanoarchaeota archaeon]
MKEKLNFHDQIQKNKIKSIFLIFIIFIFFLALGYIIAILYDPSLIFFIMSISIIFSLCYTLFSYYNSDKIALASVNAKPANSSEYRLLHNAVENMAIASSLPKPRVYVMESDQINAFASGRSPEHAVICVTTGLLRKLNKHEMEGVIAHEMAHIANFDIRFMTLTAVMVGMISILAEIFLRSLWFSNMDNRDSRGNAILLIVGIALAILAPIVAQLVSLAISRKREFAADATGIKFTRYPAGLASALKAIKSEHISDKDKHHYAKAMAPLFISNPFSAKSISGLFQTHPPIDERIKRLEAM